MKTTSTVPIMVVGVLVLAARSIADNSRLPLADEATERYAAQGPSMTAIYNLLSIPQALGPLVGLLLLRWTPSTCAGVLCLMTLTLGAGLLLATSAMGAALGFGLLGLGIGVAGTVYKVALTQTPSGRSRFVLFNATFGLSAAVVLELSRHWPSRIVLFFSLLALAALATCLAFSTAEPARQTTLVQTGDPQGLADLGRGYSSSASWLLILALALEGTAEYCAIHWLPTFFSGRFRARLVELLPETMLCITCSRIVFGFVQWRSHTVSRLWWLTLPCPLVLGGLWLGYAEAFCFAGFFYGAVSPSGYRDLADVSGRRRGQAFVMTSYLTLSGIALANVGCVELANREGVGVAAIGMLFLLAYAVAALAWLYSSGRNSVFGKTPSAETGSTL